MKFTDFHFYRGSNWIFSLMNTVLAQWFQWKHARFFMYRDLCKRVQRTISKRQTRELEWMIRFSHVVAVELLNSQRTQKMTHKRETYDNLLTLHLGYETLRTSNWHSFSHKLFHGVDRIELNTNAKRWKKWKEKKNDTSTCIWANELRSQWCMR